MVLSLLYTDDTECVYYTCYIHMKLYEVLGGSPLLLLTTF